MSTLTINESRSRTSIIPPTVPPRVIPLFIHELVQSPRPLQVQNLQCFLTNLDRTFQKAKVTDEDVMDLIAVLTSVALHDTSFMRHQSDLSGENQESLAHVTLRLLVRLSDPLWKHSAYTYRALERITRRIRHAREGTDSAELLSAESKFAAVQIVNETLDSLSPVRADAEDEAKREKTDMELLYPLQAVNANDVPVAELETYLYVDKWLAANDCRASAIEMLTTWDRSGIDVSYFCKEKAAMHLFMPLRTSGRLRVFRDFAFCTQRPKLTSRWGSTSTIHIKTNIAAQSDVMYRIMVEGYNYGVNAVIHSDVVGFTNRNWADIGDMTKYGWPEGWDAEMTNDYAPGCAISQYYSSDRFLVLRLQAKSFFSVGFSVSAWLVFNGFGAGFPIAATIHHEDDDL